MLAANYNITINNQAGTAVNICSATFYADICEAVGKKEVVSFTTAILDGANNGAIFDALKAGIGV
jgi:hypothetical protein